MGKRSKTELDQRKIDKAYARRKAAELVDEPDVDINQHAYFVRREYQRLIGTRKTKFHNYAANHNP